MLDSVNEQLRDNGGVDKAGQQALLDHLDALLTRTRLRTITSGGNRRRATGQPQSGTTPSRSGSPLVKNSSGAR